MKFGIAHFRKQRLHFSFVSALNAYKVVYFHTESLNVPLHIIQIYSVHSQNTYSKEALLSSFPEFNTLYHCVIVAYRVKNYIHLTTVMIAS